MGDAILGRMPDCGGGLQRRILSAMNLMDCIGGVVSNMVVVNVMVHLGLKAGTQILILVPLALAAAIFITKLLPRSFLMIIGRAIVVALNRIAVSR